MRDWKKWNPLCDQIGAALGYVISDDPNNCRPWRKDGKAFGPTCFDEDLQSAINAVKHLGYAV